MKPLLKIGFTDYPNTIDKFFEQTLSKVFDVVRDDNNPDYLIFCDENFGQNNLTFNNRNVIKIFYTGENRRAYNYHCHFAMTFDHDPNLKHFRLPLYVIDNFVLSDLLNLPKISDIKRNATVNEKKGFCSFVVKNGVCEERNMFFHKLCNYKKVDSGGPLFNNMGYVLKRDNLENSHFTKKTFLNERKFNICFENSSYPGYVTEKLFHALSYNTIPLYWGSPTVGLDFNPKAFISRHDFVSDEEMIQEVIRLDQDDDAYNEMLRQPIVSPVNNFFDLDRLNNWFLKVVYQGVINK